MSTIDEIKEALEKCERRPDRMNFAALELMIASAIADARREGAEQMREAAISAVHSNFMQAATRAAITEDIRALPLPTGQRQAARLTDAMADAHADAVLCAAAVGERMRKGGA
jgi:hypothetical protein